MLKPDYYTDKEGSNFEPWPEDVEFVYELTMQRSNTAVPMGRLKVHSLVFYVILPSQGGLRPETSHLRWDCINGFNNPSPDATIQKDPPHFYEVLKLSDGTHRSMVYHYSEFQDADIADERIIDWISDEEYEGPGAAEDEAREWAEDNGITNIAPA